MTTYIGLDIGGSKIASAAFSGAGEKLAQASLPTPNNYPDFLSTCAAVVRDVEGQVKSIQPVGICTAGAIDHSDGTLDSGNIPFLNDKFVRDDLKKTIGRDIRLANDSNCIALAEAIDGAGAGHSIVVGMTLATGVACGLIVNGHIVDGPHGLTGEFAHVPMPFREDGDTPFHPCICRQEGCIETMIYGAGLSRLYNKVTGQQAQPPEIGDLARQGDKGALETMDRYYNMVAKSMMVLLYAYDPHVIVVSGGLIKLPSLFEEVPKRWQKYCLIKKPIKTRFVPAVHGPIAAVRGAAWLWRD